MKAGKALAVCIALLTPGLARSADIFVNWYNSDLIDFNLGDGLCDVIAIAEGPQCSLRAAVMHANAFPGEDRIVLESGSVTTLTISGDGGASQGDLDISDDLIIEAAGVGMYLDPTTMPVIQAGEGFDDRLLQISTVATTLRQLQLRDVNMAFAGGAISTGLDCSLFIDRVRFENNTANSGGAISTGCFMQIVDSDFVGNESIDQGGAIYIEGTSLQEVIRTSFRANRAGDESGAAIYMSSPARRLTLRNSLITGGPGLVGPNRGGILAEAGNEVRILNSTLTTFHNAPALSIETDGFSFVEVYNSILAGSTLDDCEVVVAPGADITFDYNVIGDGSCADVAGDHAIFKNPDLDPIEPRPLTPVMYHRPSAGGNLIDAGSPSAAGPDVCEGSDQRGEARPQDGDVDGLAFCDIGAVEAPQQGYLHVTSAIDAEDALPGDGLCESIWLPGQPCTLRAAVMEANAAADPNVITFADDVEAISLVEPAQDGADGGDLDITQPLTLQGNAADGLPLTSITQTVAGERLVEIRSNPSAVALRNLRLSGGESAVVGGAIRIDIPGAARAEINTVEFFDNQAVSGGALYVFEGTVEVLGSDFHHNRSTSIFGAGAALHVGGMAAVSVERSSFWANEIEPGADTGALNVSTGGSLMLLNSTVAFNDSGLVAFVPSLLSVVQSTLAHNSGGGVRATFFNATDDNLEIIASLLADNGGADCVLVNAEESNTLSILDNLIGSESGMDSCVWPNNLYGLDAQLRVGASEDPLSQPPGQLSRVLVPSSTKAHTSPAIDAISDGHCAVTDQRGVLRPMDLDTVPNSQGPCDIGAVEVTLDDSEQLFWDGFEE